MVSFGCRLPKPPLSGFVGHAGECRDKDGSYGTRIEHNGAIHLDDCEAMCVKQVIFLSTQSFHSSAINGSYMNRIYGCGGQLILCWWTAACFTSKCFQSANNWNCCTGFDHTGRQV